MRLRLLVLFVAAALFTGVGTTTASAVRCTYDAPASARVDAHAGGAAGVSAALLGEAREGSAARPFDAGDASTTPSLAFIATEAVLVPGAGSGTRAINFKPNAADPNWGLTSQHLNKHLFGSGKNSLSQIDAAGNPDLWRNYIQDLAGRPATSTLKGGIEDIIGTFPKADSSGTFQFGIRISPSSDGSFDLVTLLTKQ